MGYEVPSQSSPTEELAKTNPELAARIAKMRDNAAQQAKIAGQEITPDPVAAKTTISRPVPKEWKKAQHEAKQTGDLTPLMQMGPNKQLPPGDRE